MANAWLRYGPSAATRGTRERLTREMADALDGLVEEPIIDVTDAALRLHSPSTGTTGAGTTGASTTGASTTPPQGQTPDPTPQGRTLDPARQAALDRLLGTAGGTARLAAGLAVPAAVAIPALMASGPADEQYGPAGGAVAAGGTAAGAIGGIGLGGAAGRFVSPRYGGRVGQVVGALGGGALGNAVAGGANQIASNLVQRSESGLGGFGASVGATLDDLGYTSERDLRAAAVQRQRNDPLQLEIERVQREREEEARVALIDNMLLTLAYQQLA